MTIVPIVRSVLLFASIVACHWFLGAWSLAQNESKPDSKESQTADRFLKVLISRPRTGTALEKVFAYHLENGSLDQLCNRLEQTARDGNDGQAWSVLGLIESMRGNDEMAIESLRRGEKLLTTDCMISFYLANLQVTQGEIPQAIEAYQRALSRKPNRTDALVIAREFAALYQRTGKTADALEILKQLEASYPEDLVVMEQTAEILIEGGERVPALSRYQRLAKLAKDPTSRIAFSLKAAMLESQLGNHETALNHMESLRNQINPESWLARELQSKLDDLFLSKNDTTGLISYYQNWCQSHPDDLPSFHRLAALLRGEYRLIEAVAVYREIMTRSPKDRECHIGIIEIQLSQSHIDEAIQATRELLVIDPNNMDWIVRLGTMLAGRLGPSGNENEDAEQAIAVWSTLIARNPKDPMTIVRVADLIAKSALPDRAIDLLRQAVTLAPEDPQYREFLGLALLKANRRDEAMAVWRAIAEGERRNRDNLIRLSEILAMHEEKQEAIELLASACEQSPKLTDRLRLAEMLCDAARFEESSQQMLLAKKMVEDDGEEDLFYKRQTEILQTQGQLEPFLIRWKSELDTMTADAANQWRAFAKMSVAARQVGAADDAMKRACLLAPNSIRVQSTAADLWKTMGQWDSAIAAHERLIQLDRRTAAGHYREICKMSRQMGKLDQALAAVNKVIEYANTDAESYLTVAEIYLEREQTVQGFSALQRAVRAKPKHFETIMTAARLYSKYADTERATELYWRALDTTDDIVRSNDIIKQLTWLYDSAGRFPLLLDRLDRTGNEKKQIRRYRLLKATALMDAREELLAEQTLESLSSEKAYDVDVLDARLKLAKDQGDPVKAIEILNRAVAIAPSSNRIRQMAELSFESGDVEAVRAISRQLLDNTDGGSIKLVTELMQLALAHEQVDLAGNIADGVIQKSPDDWEIYSDVIRAFSRANRKAEAIKLARGVSTLPYSIDQTTRFLKNPPGTITFERIASNVDDFCDENRNGFGDIGANEVFGGVLCLATEIELAGCQSVQEAETIWNRYKPNKESNRESLWRAYLVSQVFNRHTDHESLKELTLVIFARLVDLGDNDAILMLLQEQQRRNANTDTPENRALEKDRILRNATVASNADQQYRLIAAKLDLASTCHRLGKTELRDEWLARIAKEGPKADQLLQIANLQMEMGATGREARRLAIRGEKATNQGGLEWYLCSSLAALQESKGDNALLESLQDILEWQAEKASTLVPSRMEQQSTDTLGHSSVTNIGSRRVAFVVEYPAPSGLASSETLAALRFTQIAMANESQKALLVQKLEDWANKAQQSSHQEAVYRFAYHCALHWDGQYESAIMQLDKVLATQINSKWIARLKVRSLQQSGQLREAIELLEKTPIGFFGSLVDRELLCMQLLIQSNDRVAIRASAAKLVAQRLNSSVLSRLVDVLRQAGMTDLVQTLEDRVRRQTADRMADMVEKMSDHAANGDLTRAGEIASVVLRRAVVSRSWNDDQVANRSEAIKILRDAGQLESRIVDAENRLTQAPNSTKLWSELKELVDASDQPDRAEALVERAAQFSNSASSASLIALFKKLLAQDKPSEAASLFERSVALFVAEPTSLFEMLELATGSCKERVANAILNFGIENAKEPEQLLQFVLYHFLQSGQSHRVNDLLQSELSKKGLTKFCSMFEGLVESSGQGYKPNESLVDRILQDLGHATELRNRSSTSPSLLWLASFDRQSEVLDAQAIRSSFETLSKLFAKDDTIIDRAIGELKSIVTKYKVVDFEIALLVLCCVECGRYDEANAALDLLLESVDRPSQKLHIEALLNKLAAASTWEVAIKTKVFEKHVALELATTTPESLAYELQRATWLADPSGLGDLLSNELEKWKKAPNANGVSIAKIHLETHRYAQAIEPLIAAQSDPSEAKGIAIQRRDLQNEWNNLVRKIPSLEKIELLKRILKASSKSIDEDAFRNILGHKTPSAERPGILLYGSPFTGTSYSSALLSSILDSKEHRSELLAMLEATIPDASFSVLTTVFGCFVAHQVGAQVEDKWLALLAAKLPNFNAELEVDSTLSRMAVQLGRELIKRVVTRDLGRTLLKSASEHYEKNGFLIAMTRCQLLLVADELEHSKKSEAIERLDRLAHTDLSHGSRLSHQIGAEGNLSFYRTLYLLNLAEWAAKSNLNSISFRYAELAMVDGMPLPDLESKGGNGPYDERLDGRGIINSVMAILKRLDSIWREGEPQPDDVFHFWKRMIAPESSPQQLNALPVGFDMHYGQRGWPYGLTSIAYWATRASQVATLRTILAERKASIDNQIMEAVLACELSIDEVQRQSRFVDLLTRIEEMNAQKAANRNEIRWLDGCLSQALLKSPQLRLLVIPFAVKSNRHVESSGNLDFSNLAISSQAIGTPEQMIEIWKVASSAELSAIIPKYATSPTGMATILEALPAMKIPKQETCALNDFDNGALIDALLDMETQDLYRVAGAICDKHPKLALDIASIKLQWNVPTFRMESLSKNRPVAHALWKKDVIGITVWDVWFAAAEQLDRKQLGHMDELVRKTGAARLDSKLADWVQLLRQRFNGTTINFSPFIQTETDEHGKVANGFSHWSAGTSTVHPLDVELIYHSIKDSKIHELAKQQLKVTGSISGMAQSRAFSALRQLHASNENRKRLVHWLEVPNVLSLDTVAAWSWETRSKGILMHSGFGHDAVCYRYPLAGVFEVTGKAMKSNQLNVGFSTPGDGAKNWRVQAQPNRSFGSISRWSFGRTESEVRVGGDNGIQSHRIQSPELNANGVPPIHGFPFPWFAVIEGDVGLKVLMQAGKPSVPSEVRLIGPLMPGWVAVNGSISSHEFPIAESEPNRAEQPPANEWFIRTGPDAMELCRTNLVPSSKSSMEELSSLPVAERNVLRYQRPLQLGDTIEYEFYVDEATNAEIMIGNQVYRTSGNGVEAKPILVSPPTWLRGALDWTVEPDGRSLGKATIESHGWHRASVKMEQTSFVWSIDGNDVYRGQLADSGTALFAVCQEPSKTQLRVRNMRLTGDWPKELPLDWLE